VSRALYCGIQSYFYYSYFRFAIHGKPPPFINKDEIEILAPTTLGDALDALPQFLGSSVIADTEQMFSGGYLGISGQSTLNMRGIGGNRTLVLLDGRRFVPSNRYGTVDISLFPQQLIQRTEVVTGGASAAYGSDAVTGVTNFILNNEFEGFDANVQYGVSEIGDAQNYRLSMAGGVAVGNDGNFVFGVEGFKSDEITNIQDRDWYKSWGDIDYGPAVQPRRVRYENTIRRTETFGGIIRKGPLAGTHFLSDGTAAPFQDGYILDRSAVSGLARGVIQGNQVGGSGDQVDRWDMRRAANDRFSIYTNYKHRFSDNLTGSVQALVGRTTTDNQKIGHVMSGTWPITIYSGNPYLPESVQARMDDLGLESFQMDKRVPNTLDPLKNSRAPLVTEVASLSASLEGEFSNGWNWSFYIQHAQNNRDVDLYGFRVDRMFKAIDAVIDPNSGAITCASTLIQPNDGCVPINMFGIGNSTQEARDWVHDSMYTDATYQQSASEFVVNGEVFEGFGAGPICMAGGVNWRDDSKDAISSLGTNNIIDYCFEDGIFCDLLSYEPSGRISAINNTTINVGQARTEGVDVEASYRGTACWFGRDDNFSVRAIASHLISSTITPFNSPTREQVGARDLQDLHLTMTANYMAGPMSVSWSTRWVSDAVRSVSWVEGIDVAKNDIPSHSLSNLRLTYNMEGLGIGSESSIYLAVSNVFDKNQCDLKMLPGLYTVIGRNYSIGFNFSM